MMKPGYGSDVDEAAAFVRREPQATAATAAASTTKTKRVLAVAGVALAAGGALAAYTAVSTGTTSNDRLAAAAPLSLEASQQAPPETVLALGTPFQLRVASKNLCVDDGGGTSNGATQFVLAPCDTASANQVFQYNAETKQMRSRGKGLCVDDGGGWQNGQTKFHLWDCDAGNVNQKFDYLAATRMFKSVAKTNKCMDDGGGGSAGQTQFHLWDCDTNNGNQKFDVLPVAAYDVPLALRGGKEVVLFVADKRGLCVDDGGGTSNGATKFVDGVCDGRSADQIWIYDAQTSQFRSARKPNMCLDDGGGKLPGETRFHLWECDPRNANQRFVYDEATLQLRNPTKNLCMDDGGGLLPRQTQYALQPCDAGSRNQRFAVLCQSEATEIARGQPPAPAWVVDHPLLQQGAEFIMAVPGKDNLCVDDGGGTSSGQTQFHLWTCDPSNLNQVFRYDPATYSIRSAVKADLCVDDGGGRSNGETKFHLWQCDASNDNQKFVYDWASQRFFNPTKADMCMDDGGGVGAGQTQFHLWQCDTNNGNQHFEIIPRTAFGMPAPPPPDAVLNPILMAGDKFLLRQANKGDLCVDDGGGSSNGETKFVLAPCDPLSPNQQFTYDARHGMAIRSVKKDGLCVDDGGGTSNGQTKFHLWQCDASNNNQKFVYDAATMMFHNPTKTNLCMDDGGGAAAGDTQFHLWECDPSNFNQKFEVVGVDALDQPPMEVDVVTPPPMQHQWPIDHPLLLSGEEFIMAVPGKDNLCVDDGGGTSSGQTQFHLWTCDPSNLNQVFRYDPATYSIRSAVKADLCVDDGGGRSNGETKFHLWQCDASNDNQKFVYDWVSQRFFNPTKPGMCMDDGGGVASGQTKFHLWQCDVSNRNQHFEIIRRPTIAEQGPQETLMTMEPILVGPDGIYRPNPDGEGDTGAPTGEYGIPGGYGSPVDETYGNPDEPSIEPVEPIMDGPGGINPPTGEYGKLGEFSGEETPMQPMSLDESDAFPSAPDLEPANPVDPANPHPQYEESTLVEGDWNLLAPSKDTIGVVNADGSDDITSGEIYAYLLGIKDDADETHAKTLAKYRRTTKCVTDGLESLAKSSVSADEYHALVLWMYEHCLFNGRTPVPPPTEPGASPVEEPVIVDRVYMTKLEFYQQIKDHFDGAREELFGQAASARLRSEVSTVQRKKLLACIQEASARFGCEKEYEQPEHFHNAILWVQDECMGSP